MDQWTNGPVVQWTNGPVVQCIMAQALKKFGIKDSAKNYDLGSHFLKPELFDMKIFGCSLLYSFTFNSYMGTS